MNEQLLIAVIDREVDGNTIPQRAADGYVNATAICKASGKNFADYRRLATTEAFLTELSSVMGIPITELVISVQGGNPRLQGTWLHPDAAIHLGQWCSPKFAVAVARWVREWMSGTIKPATLPYHLQRYMANRAAVPPTHWSMLNELTFLLIAPLEERGYCLPEKLVPDISEGKMFCKWLREEKGVEPNDMPTYQHVYQDGRIVYPKLYPNELLADFRRHFHGVWMQQRAMTYFDERDPKALDHLPILIEYSKTILLEDGGKN